MQTLLKFEISTYMSLLLNCLHFITYIIRISAFYTPFLIVNHDVYTFLVECYGYSYNKCNDILY